MTPAERAFARTMARLAVCNHFLPERIELEREALGPAFEDSPAVAWNLDSDSGGRSPNIVRLTEKTAGVLGKLRGRFRKGGRLSGEEVEGYEALVFYHLYQHYRSEFQSLTLTPQAATRVVKCYGTFCEDAERLLRPALEAGLERQENAHLFAGLWQIERAFINIFQNIIGSSRSIVRLRATVWESIFTCNFKRYREGLYKGMSQITTLITGPSGTGKELVARAIACSGYIPFDANRQTFASDARSLLYALSLSALPLSLIESELFGHKRGAFTGALADHAGWLEACPKDGSVFLDEIGEIEASLQVKLLRVLQTRTFQRLGESRSRRFEGKIIAATNRDLVAEIEAGRFREDFYYRICADVLSAPSLREQLAEAPGDLKRLVCFITRRLVSPEQTEELTEEVVRVVATELGSDYGWPGNFRELEQCVRNVLVRGRYNPAQIKPREPAAALAADIAAGRLTAEELLQRYCAVIYRQTHNL